MIQDYETTSIIEQLGVLGDNPMKTFCYYAPNTVDGALELLKPGGSQSKVFAGGTDLLVQMKNLDISPAKLIDIKRIPGLNNIRFTPNGYLEIGPLATISELASDTKVAQVYPALTQAASSIGSVQTRNKATVGGNICRAAPSADLAPALLIYEAKVTVMGIHGSRELMLDEFFLGPGQTVMGTDEILTQILVPPLSGPSSSLYIKQGRRKSVDLAIVGTAVVLEWQTQKKVGKECRIALASVAPRPIRARRAEALLRGRPITPSLIEQCSKEASDEAMPISDAYGSEWYKRDLVKALVARCLRKITDS